MDSVHTSEEAGTFIESDTSDEDGTCVLFIALSSCWFESAGCTELAASSSLEAPAVGLAIGTAGLEPLYNQIGGKDMFGNVLEVTEPAVADELAAGASLVMGQAAEACPVVLARGALLTSAEVGSAGLLRDKSLDMFR